jgi:hypothetical protein
MKHGRAFKSNIKSDGRLERVKAFILTGRNEAKIRSQEINNQTERQSHALRWNPE